VLLQKSCFQLLQDVQKCSNFLGHLVYTKKLKIASLHYQHCYAYFRCLASTAVNPLLRLIEFSGEPLRLIIICLTLYFIACCVTRASLREIHGCNENNLAKCESENRSQLGASCLRNELSSFANFR